MKSIDFDKEWSDYCHNRINYIIWKDKFVMGCIAAMVVLYVIHLVI